MVWKVYHFVLPCFRLHFTHGNKLSEFRETLLFGFKWEGDLSQHFDEVCEPLWSEPNADDWFKKGSKKAEVKLLHPPLPPSRSWPPVLWWNMVVVNIVHHRTRQLNERWSIRRHRVFKCCVGKSSCSETFRLRGSFHCGAENVNGRFTEMSFLWRRSRFADCPRCLFIVSSTFAQKKSGGRPDGGKNKKRNTSHQVRLHCLADGTICKSVLSATRSRTAPRRTMSAARRTIRHRLFYPRCPLTLSTRLLIHTHTHYVYNTHTHTAVYDDGYFSAEWRVGSAEDHLATRGIALSAIIQGHVSQGVGRCEASLSGETE